MNDIAMTTVGSLPAVRICAPDGASATITLYGAHVVSWIPASGKERLFMSRKSALDGNKAIRGGIPVIFPQFAEQGSGMRHGFARVSNWRCTGQDGNVAEFELNRTDLAPALAADWPYHFALTVRVEVEGESLTLSLNVKNTGPAAFAFAAALHTYYKVDNVGGVRVHGVMPEELRIDGKLDRIFRNVSSPIRLDDTALYLSGFTDAVVWNPGAADAAALSDWEDEEYQEFICVEPALLTPVRLETGSSWEGTHRIGGEVAIEI
jgi:glucose-6-phosphate 1-epimerase